MTLEQVWFPLAPSASHDPEWRSSFNPSVRTNPYISSGDVQDQCADQKTPFFGEFSISRRLMGPLRGPRDIECGSDYRPKPGSSGNPGFGNLLGRGWGGFGYDQYGKCRYHALSSAFNGISVCFSTYLCKNNEPINDSPRSEHRPRHQIEP